MSRPAAAAALNAVAARLTLASLELGDDAYRDLLRRLHDLIARLAVDVGPDADPSSGGEPEPAAGPLLAPPSLDVRVYLECAPEARYYAATSADAARLRLWLGRRRDLTAALRLLGTERIEATAAGDDLDLADLLAGGEG